MVIQDGVFIKDRLNNILFLIMLVNSNNKIILIITITIIIEISMTKMMKILQQLFQKVETLLEIVQILLQNSNQSIVLFQLKLFLVLFLLV